MPVGIKAKDVRCEKLFLPTLVAASQRLRPAPQPCCAAEWGNVARSGMMLRMKLRTEEEKQWT